MARHYPSLDVNVLGVNERGHESGNELATTDRSLPLLQDVDINNDQSSDVWQSWEANWHNVRVVDRSNDLQFVVNLLTYPLEESGRSPGRPHEFQQPQERPDRHRQTGADFALPGGSGTVGRG